MQLAVQVRLVCAPNDHSRLCPAIIYPHAITCGGALPYRANADGIITNDASLCASGVDRGVAGVACISATAAARVEATACTAANCPAGV